MSPDYQQASKAFFWYTKHRRTRHRHAHTHKRRKPIATACTNNNTTTYTNPSPTVGTQRKWQEKEGRWGAGGRGLFGRKAKATCTLLYSTPFPNSTFHCPLLCPQSPFRLYMYAQSTTLLLYRCCVAFHPSTRTSGTSLSTYQALFTQYGEYRRVWMRGCEDGCAMRYNNWPASQTRPNGNCSQTQTQAQSHTHASHFTLSLTPNLGLHRHSFFCPSSSPYVAVTVVHFTLLLCVCTVVSLLDMSLTHAGPLSFSFFLSLSSDGRRNVPRSMYLFTVLCATNTNPSSFYISSFQLFK